ncbi:uncharacterized protein EI90DRAFT_3158108 [Cantharellus anzutake]|uniref:uncharacterized protein n=1 Tax=Cantharellus anzutake TaxID=1750568 RepID=UPI00190409AB|nr:uncharacterized protein EI90DRAFT_3158108 [Cantharellus anzutake]KAF8320588.1 hypothetical protein EI90DRAFT_3158108 [Cantharellus anzutake]
MVDFCPIFSGDSYNQTCQALYCAANCGPTIPSYQGICPNPDASGMGVRVAFYLQALMNTILVIVSPNESAKGAWSAVVLTAALIIPATIQKYQRNLSLHHATIVLNFSTLSCVTSLAVAPMCSLWHPPSLPVGPGASSEGHASSRNDGSIDDYGSPWRPSLTTDQEKQNKRSRIVLSVALLLQISLQWYWTINLFTSHTYAQPWASGDTILMFFAYPFRVSSIAGSTPHSNGRVWYGVWPLWLSFCLLVTSCYGILFVLRATEFSEDEGMLSRMSSMLTTVGATTASLPSEANRKSSWVPFPEPDENDQEAVALWYLPPAENRLAWRLEVSGKRLCNRVVKWAISAGRLIGRMVGAAMPPMAYNTGSNLLSIKRRIWVGNFLAFCTVTFFLIVTEIQINVNNVLPGEDSVWSLGQMAAILLALTPAWELSTEVYMYFQRKGQVRKEKSRRQRERKERFRKIAETVARMNPNRPTERRRFASALNFPPAPPNSRRSSWVRMTRRHPTSSTAGSSGHTPPSSPWESPTQTPASSRDLSRSRSWPRSRVSGQRSGTLPDISHSIPSTTSKDDSDTLRQTTPRVKFQSPSLPNVSLPEGDYSDLHDHE